MKTSYTLHVRDNLRRRLTNSDYMRGRIEGAHRGAEVIAQAVDELYRMADPAAPYTDEVSRGTKEATRHLADAIAAAIEKALGEFDTVALGLSWQNRKEWDEEADDQPDDQLYCLFCGDIGTEGTLEAWRCHRTGPAFRKLHGRVLYTPQALDAFLAGAVEVKTVDSLPGGRKR